MMARPLRRRGEAEEVLMRFILGIAVGIAFGYGLANLLTKPEEPSNSRMRERAA
jgi:NhaP-type Na+/H+ or K+/H+ antiporter